MKEELQIALRALENNLKDIQSANETVNQVREKAAEDIKAAGLVIQRMNTELDEINTHFNNWLSSFNETAKDTFKAFDNKANESVKKMTALNDTLKSHLDANLDSFSESSRLLFQKYEAAWEKHNQELNRVFLKFEDLKQTIDSLKNQINQVDFPTKLDKIGNEILLIGKLQKDQTKRNEVATKSQGTNFTVLIVIGAAIILLQLATFFIK